MEGERRKKSERGGGKMKKEGEQERRRGRNKSERKHGIEEEKERKLKKTREFTNEIVKKKTLGTEKKQKTGMMKTENENTGETMLKKIRLVSPEIAPKEAKSPLKR